MNGTVKIHGKDYKPVVMRVNEFRAEHPDWGIHTELVESGDNVIVKAIIADDKGRVRGTGYAEEVRGSTNINKTSALENCETSAIGRALAACGYAGTEYASANEVSDAILQQEIKAHTERYIQFADALRRNLASVEAIISALATEDLSMASEAYQELSDDDKKALWLAPTNGGIFTTNERKIMKSTEFREAYFGGKDE